MTYDEYGALYRPLLSGGYHSDTSLPIVTHFSMWAILKSPLILGNDLSSMVGVAVSWLIVPSFDLGYRSVTVRRDLFNHYERSHYIRKQRPSGVRCQSYLEEGSCWRRLATLGRLADELV